MSGKFRFAIDRGGTFTDIYATCPSGKVVVTKLLSEDPKQYSDAPFEGIRRIMKDVIGNDSNENGSLIEWIRIGTTLATNALLERKGHPTCLAITKGFKDVLYIGNQARPQLFDLDVKVPDVIYDYVIEVDERLWVLRSDCQLPPTDKDIVESKSGERFVIEKALDEEKLACDLRHVAGKGIKSLAVVLLHSYGWAGHETTVERLATEAGFTQISLSSKVMPMVSIVPRGQTTCVDAYLTPCIKSYVADFVENIRGLVSTMRDRTELTEIADLSPETPIHFMQSDGGLVHKDEFMGSRAILSGPAGGVIGYSRTTYLEMGQAPVIGFDMGGTSTDVSRYDGQYEHVYDSVIGGVTMQCPQLDIQTVAAGGGSRLFFRGGLFVVGPESAGANPGPRCYRKGGPLCITDANLCLGRILPEYFPKIFGPGRDEEIDKESSTVAFGDLTDKINQHYKISEGKGSHTNDPRDQLMHGHLSVEQVAMGFISVANETMCRTIRNITQAKGYETSKHVLACFGSAAGQHACSLARSLGIKKVFIHKYSGILSAFGMALADVVHEVQEPVSLSLRSTHYETIYERLLVLGTKCQSSLKSQGFQTSKIKIESYLQMCYEGTQCLLMCHQPNDSLLRDTNDLGKMFGAFEKVFLDKYQTEFGFNIPDREIMVENIRVRGIGSSSIQLQELDIASVNLSSETPEPIKKVVCYFQEDPQNPRNVGEFSTSIYLMEKLSPEHEFQGPAIVIDNHSTIIVEPNCGARMTPDGNLVISIGELGGVTGVNSFLETSHTSQVDPIKLSLFSNRFMGIAEQMGRMLKRMAISTNIKERLDFSCSIFGPDGGLVANAPHIPVHLGSMQEAVKYQMNTLRMKDGDVILTNHPCAGGSHLPDLTVIKPVFHPSSKDPIFYVASRGHHADIGGILPGSMPATSTSLSQEGATFKSFMLIDKGKFMEKELITELMKPGTIPGSSGSRKLDDNIADLKAQVAACHKGIVLVHDLINEYGMKEVLNYMLHIRTNARDTVSQMFKTSKFGNDGRKNSATMQRLHAKDYMDDGTVINLTVDINRVEGTAIFDFSGTGYQVLGNCNTPKAITLSALLYCLRCMVGHDIPMNQGCLEPVEVIIPKGSILDPSEDAAVVGGNVQTSQRIVDVIFRAFQTCAASQGCMNNVTFGDPQCVYYETIAGGAGAGPGFNGRSGIHTHMTNTRITDPETFERRFPIILKQFGLRHHSNGTGQYQGGQGIVREIMFRRPLTLSILTERRVFHPYGLKGGTDGSRGLNILIRADGRIINMGSKATTIVQPGDTFLIKTPGGGGYGQKLPEN